MEDSIQNIQLLILKNVDELCVLVHILLCKYESDLCGCQYEDEGLVPLLH